MPSPPKRRALLGVALALATFALMVAPVSAQEMDAEADPTASDAARWAQLADRIVNISANVGPGDAVVIAGGGHNVPLMEQIAIEAAKAGGQPLMILTTDRLERSVFTEVPMEHLGQEAKLVLDLIKNADVWIGLPGVEDPEAVYGDVPEERFAEASKANQAFQEVLNETPLRGVFIGYPTATQARINRIPLADLEAMHWAAVDADYDAISRQGHRIQQLLRSADQVRVTTPAGTDLSFTVGDRPVFVDDGIVTTEDAQSDLIWDRTAGLPGGGVFFAPVETSVEGRVVVPRSRCRFAPLTDVRFDVVAGEARNLSATEGQACFEGEMEPYAGPKMRVGSISIGLNPAIQVREEGGADYRPGDAAGMVTVSLGQNQLLGGENDTEGSFYFPLVGATIEVDGQTIVRDGQVTVEAGPRS
ncbi:MAG TPA: aminopeptidase [Gemmatimonadota bacterium]|nr:aminopeptidase [Gemmatimonadota bacterium]